MYPPDKTTYMAGCTDEEWTSPSCPLKDSSHQQLLGMVQCEGTETTSSQILWSGCPGATTKTALGAPQECTCSDPSNAFFTGATSFPQVASLPTAIGETISFHSGHTPSRQGVATMTSTAENGHKTTMTMPDATAGSSTGSGSGGLSTGAKAGVGVGAAALGIGLLALAAFLLPMYRRRRARRAGGGPDGGAAKYEAGAATTAPGPGQAGAGAGYGGPFPPPPQYATSGGGYHEQCHNGQPVSPMGEMAAGGYAGSPGFTGFKSELPCENEVKPAVKSELPADSPTARALDKGAGAPSVMSAAGESPGPNGHDSMVSDVSSEGHGRGPNGGSMSPIAELHG